jgi:hypothetical protein
LIDVLLTGHETLFVVHNGIGREHKWCDIVIVKLTCQFFIHMNFLI